MRTIAVVIVPVCLLGLVETGLRAGGYGYSAKFFLPREIEGEDYLIPNRKFTHQFFPPKLARDPLPSRMVANKPEGTYRIFLFGESAAYGDPDPAFGMGRFLETLLEIRYPQTDFEVFCVAVTAINSHVILPIALDCTRQDGDMWIIYMGNNEMVGPFGAGTVFGDKAPSRGFVKTSLLVRSTRLGQLLANMMTALNKESLVPESWGGIDMFTKNKLRYDNPARLKAYENFKGNLYDIILTGQRAGVPIVLSTVGSNLRDCSPFISSHSDDPGLDLTAWDRFYHEGLALEAEGAFERALDKYFKAASIDDQFAELQYRIGKCHKALGNGSEALDAFTRARDYDMLVVRADSRINAIIREAIGTYDWDNLIGVDAAAFLAEESPAGIPGRELFYEHVHLTVEGNFKLARLFADELANQLPPSITSTGHRLNVDFEFQTCADRLAFTLWDQKRVWNVALDRISIPPFTSQSNHEDTIRYFEGKMQEVDRRTTRSSWNEVIRSYESALRLNPDDTLIRWNYAQFLDRNGATPEAIDQAKQVCLRLPHVSWPHYYVGSLLAKEDRIAEAVEYLRAALQIQPDIPLAQDELDRIATAHPAAVE